MGDLQGVQASRTAEISKDNLGLGRTAGQRNAEIVAGIRAELDPSPLSLGLSRYTGRLAARLLFSFGGKSSHEVLSVVLAQTRAILHLAEEKLKASDKLIVNLASGFGPHGFELARKFPNIEVIEIDLPDVVKEKERRLRKAPKLEFPENLSWIAADLGVQSLDDALGGRVADMIIAPGFMSYFYPDEVKSICKKIKASLRPDGFFIGDVVWRPELSHYKSGASWFGRNSATFLCVPNSIEEAKSLLESYEDVQFYFIADLLTDEERALRFKNMSVVLSARAS